MDGRLPVWMSGEAQYQSLSKSNVMILVSSVGVGPLCFMESMIIGSSQPSTEMVLYAKQLY